MKTGLEENLSINLGANATLFNLQNHTIVVGEMVLYYYGEKLKKKYVS